MTQINQSISEAGGTGSVDLNTLTVRTNEILTQNWIGVHALAKIEAMGMGTARFTKPEMLRVTNFNSSVSGSTSNVIQTGAVGKVDVPMNIKKSIIYELDETELAGLMDSSAIEGRIAGSAAISIMAYLDAEMFVTAINATGRQTDIVADLHTFNQPDIGFPIRTLKNAYGNLENLYTQYSLGLDGARLFAFVSVPTFNNLTNSFNNSNLAVEIALGSYTVNKLFEMNIVKHGHLGKNLKTSAFAKETDNGEAANFDFSNIDAVIFHSTAIAIPVNFNKATIVKSQTTGFNRYIFAIQHGREAIVPEFIQIIKSA